MRWKHLGGKVVDVPRVLVEKYVWEEVCHYLVEVVEMVDIFSLPKMGHLRVEERKASFLRVVVCLCQQLNCGRKVK